MSEPAPYDRCIRCGLCLPSCPTYLETLTETSGPRGRIALMKAVAEGQAEPLSPGFTEQMSQCLDCRACEAACPSGVEYGRLLESARAGIREAAAPSEGGASRAAGGILLGLFSHLERLRAAAVALRALQRSGIVRLAPGRLAPLVALAPRIADRFFVPDGRGADAVPSHGLAFLHAGCIMQVAFPNVHEAATRMVGRAGLSVDVPLGQGCCGAIAAHAGEPGLARELAKRNIAAFEQSGADVYVADAAGCSAALKEYGNWFEDDESWAQRALRFSQRVRDVTEVLDAMPLDPPLGRLNATVTYQEPCHLAHAQRVTGAPRRL